ncbi:unnamed protein product, partial [Mesorhabditis spiculigera]
MESFEHHRIDLERLLEKTSASGIDIEEIQNASRFCRFLGTQEDSNAFFDSPSTSDKVISGFQQRLFDVAVSGFEDGDTRAPDLRRSASALRLLYNAGNLSTRLKQTLPQDCLRLFRALLRIKELRPEVIAVIFQLSEKLYTVHALDDEYNKLLGELVLLWEKDGNERQWIDALLMTRLDDDGAFLAHAFADFEPAHFLALLNVTDVFLEAKLEVHNNNIQFVSDLILRIFFDFENEELQKIRLDFYLESLLPGNAKAPISFFLMHSIIVNQSCASLDRIGSASSRASRARFSARSHAADDVELGLSFRPSRIDAFTDRPVIDENSFADSDTPATSRSSLQADKLEVEADDGRDSGIQVEFEDVQHFRGLKRLNKRPPPFSIEAHTTKYIPRGSVKVTPKTPNPERWPSAFYFPDEDSAAVLKDEELVEEPRFQLSKNCLVMFLLFLVIFACFMGIFSIDMAHYYTAKPEPNFPGYANLPLQPLPADPSAIYR